MLHHRILASLLTISLASAIGLVLPNDTTPNSGQRIGHNDTVSGDVQAWPARRPSFRNLVAEGVRLAYEVRGNHRSGPIWKIINWTSSSARSVDVNEFVHIDMELKVGWPGEYYAVLLKSHKSLWHSWTGELEDRGERIDADDRRKGFLWAWIDRMDQSQAMSLARTQTPGPFNVIQMCEDRRAPGSSILYAFADVDRIGEGPFLDARWTVVNVQSRLVTFFIGDPCATTTPTSANILNGTVAS